MTDMEKGKFYLNVRLCTALFSKAVGGGRYASCSWFMVQENHNHGQQHFVSLHRKSGRAGHLVCWFLVLSILTIERKGSYQIFNINDELNYFFLKLIMSLRSSESFGKHWIPQQAWTHDCRPRYYDYFLH